MIFALLEVRSTVSDDVNSFKLNTQIRTTTVYSVDSTFGKK